MCVASLTDQGCWDILGAWMAERENLDPLQVVCAFLCFVIPQYSALPVPSGGYQDSGSLCSASPTRPVLFPLCCGVLAEFWLVAFATTLKHPYV